MSLGALFYPVGTKENPINFDSLFIPYIYKEIYLEGLYNDIFQPQIDNPNNEKIVLDIGGNLGIVTDYMRKYSKKVYTIEPSPEHFEALKKNKEFNNWDNVELFNFAIADKDGEMDFHRSNTNRTCNSLALAFQDEDVIKVKTVALDTFFKDNNITHVDFAKVDVEGGEDLIFRSESFARVAPMIDALEVELHFPTWPLLVKHMEGFGYKARRYESSAVVILFYR
jgi:FkbM family methyltransferase